MVLNFPLLHLASGMLYCEKGNGIYHLISLLSRFLLENTLTTIIVKSTTSILNNRSSADDSIASGLASDKFLDLAGAPVM